MSVFAPEFKVLRGFTSERVTGRVAALRGLTVLVEDLPMPVGSLVEVVDRRAGPGEALVRRGRPGEVVGFSRDHAVVMMLGQTTGVRPGQAVVGVRDGASAEVGRRLLGRVVDALGRPVDGGGPIVDATRRPLDADPLGPMRRARVTEPMRTGVRVLDLMTPLGRGQRLGLFAGPGVGKSTLLGQIARAASSDVNVIALIGERGREVREFVEESLGSEGLGRSVVVAATGDEPPLMRIRAAKLACAVAEHFRDLGRHVLLMMDSVTRFAHAQRQVGLSAGEPPATKGYTPSVFAELGRLLERAGSVRGEGGVAESGSITGLYTVLVEGDDMTEPVADAARGILDGHVVLSRRLAQRGHFPAVDVLDSVSRLANQVSQPAHAAARQQVVRMLAAYAEVEELERIGAYARGGDPETDAAIELRPAIEALLQQAAHERGEFNRDAEILVKLAVQSGEMVHALRQAHAAGARAR